MRPGPLAGIRVVDLTQNVAGPYCTMQLADMGADVLKVEPIGVGDNARAYGPAYPGGERAGFGTLNRNKRSLAVNLKQPEGSAIVERLVAQADVIVESFRPGVMERLCIGYEALKAIKHDIVMVSISACGQTGPERNYRGYAPLFGATGGLGTLTGFADGPPVEMRHAMDHGTGLAAAAATLAAYLRKKRTGKGQHVDISAREVATSFIGDALLQ